MSPGHRARPPTPDAQAHPRDADGATTFRLDVLASSDTQHPDGLVPSACRCGATTPLHHTGLGWLCADCDPGWTGFSYAPDDD